MAATAAPAAAHKCRRYEGRLCVVTASTQGIGLAIAERFAEEGACVVVSSRKQEAVTAAVAHIQSRPGVAPNSVKGIVCHVTDPVQRKAMLAFANASFEGKPTIDVLVLNAAISTFMGPTIKTPAKHFDKMMQTNVRDAFLMAQEALPFMTASVARKKAAAAAEGKKSTAAAIPAGAFSSSILFVGSVAGIHPAAPIGVYGVSKTALMGLTRSLGHELAPFGVRVNLLAPGVIRTSFATLLVDAVEAKTKGGDTGAFDEGVIMSSMGRVGEPREMAGVASFLCSADASYVTGETFVAAGGPARL